MSLNPPTDVKTALALARQLGLERGDAQTLLAERLKQSRAWLISHDDEALSPALAAQLASEMQQMAEACPWPMCWAKRSSMACACA